MCSARSRLSLCYVAERPRSTRCSRLRPVRSVDVAAGAADRPRGRRRGGLPGRGRRRLGPASTCARGCWPRRDARSAERLAGRRGLRRAARGQRAARGAAAAESTAPDPGIRRRRRGQGLRVPRRATAAGSTEPSVARADPRARDPARLGGRLDLPATRCGHIQATGIDAAGRKQYRYHDRWRERRDREKFDEMIELRARAARAARAGRRATSSARGCRASACSPARCACSTAASSGSAREDYAEENDTYGIATMHKRHVTIAGRRRSAFDYEAKGGQRRLQSIGDPEVARDRARRSSAAAAAATSCSRTSEGRRWARRQVGRHQRVRQGGDRRRLQRQGLPHLERHGAGGGRAGRVRPGGTARRARASGPRRGRSRRSRATSATRRPSRAPPTSTRACSTASTAG